jgi:hypothetical protein
MWPEVENAQSKPVLRHATLTGGTYTNHFASQSAAIGVYRRQTSTYDIQKVYKVIINKQGKENKGAKENKLSNFKK